MLTCICRHDVAYFWCCLYSYDCIEQNSMRTYNFRFVTIYSLQGIHYQSLITVCETFPPMSVSVMLACMKRIHCACKQFRLFLDSFSAKSWSIFDCKLTVSVLYPVFCFNFIISYMCVCVPDEKVHLQAQWIILRLVWYFVLVNSQY